MGPTPSSLEAYPSASHPKNETNIWSTVCEVIYKVRFEKPDQQYESHILAPAIPIWLLQSQFGSCSHIFTPAVISWLLHIKAPAATSGILHPNHG